MASPSGDEVASIAFALAESEFAPCADPAKRGMETSATAAHSLPGAEKQAGIRGPGGKPGSRNNGGTTRYAHSQTSALSGRLAGERGSRSVDGKTSRRLTPAPRSVNCGRHSALAWPSPRKPHFGPVVDPCPSEPCSPSLYSSFGNGAAVFTKARSARPAAPGWRERRPSQML